VSKLFQGVNFHSYAKDLLSSFVVFIIAVPLSLGIALASGMPTTSALVAAAVGGILVGLLSGAPMVVSGPAAGLSAMVLGFVATFGIEAVYRITVLVGIFQLLFGVFRLGKLIDRIPKVVLEGVLTAIGLIILVGQLHIWMGGTVPGDPLTNILALPRALMAALTTGAWYVRPAFVAGIVAMATQLVFPKIIGKHSWIPAALPACFLGTLVALGSEVPRVQMSPIGLHVSTAFGNIVNAETWNHLTFWLGPALGLAVVASAETLLTARAIQLIAEKRLPSVRTQPNRELFAQGVGNITAGLLGGMPLTGVMVRSAANLEAGAVSRYSTVLHGFWVLLCVSLFPFVMEAIPLSVLASILVVTGYRLINPAGIYHAIKFDGPTAWFWPGTALFIFATDLLMGFGLSLALYLIYFLVRKTAAA
jgi:MFS superfamily sulfate permease-like transporter